MTRRSRLALLALIALLCATGISPPEKKAENPDLARLDRLLREFADEVTQASPGIWNFRFFDVHMACITNAEHNRMRVVAPVVEMSQVSAEQYRAMLDANFHTALDARYASSDGVLYSLFLHPLSTLGDDQFRSAVLQVASLARTFGKEYSSGVLRYGAEKEAL